MITTPRPAARNKTIITGTIFPANSTTRLPPAPDDDPHHDAVNYAEGQDGNRECRGEALGDGIRLDAGEEVGGKAHAEDRRQYRGDTGNFLGSILPMPFWM